MTDFFDANKVISKKYVYLRPHVKSRGLLVQWGPPPRRTE